MATVLTVAVGTLGLTDRTEGPAGGAETGPTGTDSAETGPNVSGPIETGPDTSSRYPTWHVSEQDLAFGQSLLDAWVAGDGEAVAAMFDPSGTFDGFESGIVPSLHDWFRGGGWTFRGGRCERHVDTSHDDDLGLGYVGCGFTYENDLTRALAMPPQDVGLALVIDADRVTAAWTWDAENIHTLFRSPDPDREDLFGPVWDTFINWIASTTPRTSGGCTTRVTATRSWIPTRSICGIDTPTSSSIRRLQSLTKSFDLQARRVCAEVTDAFWATVRANDLGGGTGRVAFHAGRVLGGPARLAAYDPDRDRG